jgi:hypothetical protein
MAANKMMNARAFIGCTAILTGTGLIFASSLSFAEVFWAQGDSSWCLQYENSSTCLPVGSTPSKISAGEVIFEFVDDFQPPVVISSISDEQVTKPDYALEDAGAEVLYSSTEFDVKTTVLKAVDLYFVEFTLAPNANLRIAGFKLDQAESIASDIIQNWALTKSSNKKNAERSCGGFFHAGCVEN